jgi:hypothetical protein
MLILRSPLHVRAFSLLIALTLVIVMLAGCSGTPRELAPPTEISVMPDMDGRIRAMSLTSAAIRSGSSNQLNAWNFIKLMLAPEYQMSGSIGFIPVCRSSIIAQFDRLHNRFEGERGTFTPFSEDEKQTYIDFITNIDYSDAYRYDPVADMFREHTESFLKDEISYETAIAGLRNQLRLYVSE